VTELVLEAVDRALLAGEFGEAAAHAMKLLSRYAVAVRADRFVSVASAHIDGCLYHGPSSLDFARRYVALGGRVRVPTTLNVAAIDLVHKDRYPGRTELAEWQTELVDLHEQLGCLPTLTCAPYQRMLRPRLGEHVAWAESNAIVFVNSVLGARTDRYGDFTDLFGSLTGRVPYAGLHRDENRLARVVVEVEPPAPDMARDLYFACLGYALGARVAGRVAALVGLAPDATEDELKGLGAAAASSGAVALFHAVGITPEAPSLEVAVGGDPAGLETLRITAADLQAVVARLCPLETGAPVAAVCLGTPHFSLNEFANLARLVEGRRRDPTVEVYVSTSREIAAQVEADAAFSALSDFGVTLVVDTCTYVAGVVRRQQGALLTNSAKWAHYAPGTLRRSVGLAPVERCIRAAETGRLGA
jgi:predicted aconitase